MKFKSNNSPNPLSVQLLSLSYLLSCGTAKCTSFVHLMPLIKILLAYISMGNNSFIENKSVGTTDLLCATLLEVARRHLKFIVVQYYLGFF